MNSFSPAATIIQMSRPSGDFPREIILSCGAAATSLRNQAVVSSKDGVKRKSVFSAGVIHGSFLGAIRARLFPFHAASGGRTGWLAAGENSCWFAGSSDVTSVSAITLIATKNAQMRSEVFTALQIPSKNNGVMQVRPLATWRDGLCPVRVSRRGRTADELPLRNRGAPRFREVQNAL